MNQNNTIISANIKITLKSLSNEGFIIGFQIIISDAIITEAQYKTCSSYIFKQQLDLMGLLSDLGPIQDFPQTMKVQRQLKIIGVRQFINRLKMYQSWSKPAGMDHIKWGEEIQGHFLKVNQHKQLQLCKEDISEEYKDLSFPLMFQYGSWMFEMIPNQPYSTNCNFYEIITSIRDKYDVLHSKSRIAMTIPIIPFMGVRHPQTEKDFNNQITQSLYIDDSHIAHHPRFKTLTKNIRLRRGKTVEIYVPVLMDQNTDLAEINKTQPKEGFIHMDAMAFGMGACCLQCTFSTKSFDHARYLYDQLNVLSPIFLALTAGSPFFKGKVSDWDVRWNVISQSVDDRTQNQRNPQHHDFLPTSRYSSANYYLWNNEINHPQYNDFNTGVREQDIAFIKQIAAKDNIEMDQMMIFHLANIFRRDFLIVHRNFKDMSEKEFTLFEMLNGTNWNSVRFKIPIDDHIGWRVQFRTYEVQLTADQNSAFSLLIHLITRVLHQNTHLNFYIPISMLMENFNRAHKKDALRKQKFYFRTNIHSPDSPIIDELTIFEILFGKNDFKGIFYEIQCHVEGCMKVCNHVKILIETIKKFLHETASGQRPTLARWMRTYVDQHPDYKHNSILPKKVMDDLLLTLHKISKGEIQQKTFSKIFPNWKQNQFEDLTKCSKFD